MAVKNAVAKAWAVAASSDGLRWSNYPAGDKPSGDGSAPLFFESFGVAQTPIGSPWIKNATLCKRVITTGGYATNDARNGVDNPNDDAYAYVSTSAFQAPNDDYEVTVTLAEPGGNAMETEVLVRVTDDSSGYHAYELLINGGGYAIVRIDGGVGGFYQIFDGTAGTPNTVGSFPASLVAGDKVRFRVTGVNPVRLQAWYALAATPNTFVQVLDVTDASVSRKQTGQPGIGFYSANVGAAGNKGWADFYVSAIYATTFSTAETPISEGGRWLKQTPEGGSTDHSGWHGLVTSGGNIKPRYNSGTATGGPLAGEYDDCYQYLSGTWPENLRAEATIYVGAGNKEVELLLRVSDQASPARVWAYECLFDIGVGSVEIARWNGAPTDYSTLNAGSPGQYFDGDRVAAEVTGTNPVVITCYLARAATPNIWTPILTYTDSSGARLTSGAPGIGMFVRSNAANPSLDYGFKDYSVVPLQVQSFDFTTMSLQDPLSAGGVFTNNTQATGENTVYNEQTSIRIIAAATGGINIAAGDSVGQDAPPAPADYLDSFAFLPGFKGNQRITAVVYKDSGYTPTDNHEIELLLGCSTSSGSGGNGEHRLVECLWSTGAALDMATFGSGVNGSYPGAPNDWNVSISPTNSGAIARAPLDGDVWVAEYIRSANTVVTRVNGVQVLNATNALLAMSGDGIGIATFRRTANGTSAANRLGFKSIKVESF